MIAQIAQLIRFRPLIQSLVARELKARYRGSVLGYFWSFINPLLLLLTYGLVFSFMLRGVRSAEIEPYFLFLFCGILPWTWFNASVLEASNVLIAGGSLIKKVLFPAEVLPVVTVLANLVHFLFGLPILLICLGYYGRLSLGLVWLPVPLAIQLLFTLGLALIVSALTVHFRDIQNILSHLLHLWFFASPVLYAYDEAPQALRTVLRVNPMTHVIVAYQDIFFRGVFRFGLGLAAAAVVALATFALGAFLFERLRDTLAEEV
jgi:lipopolysaccharide transport system permease protein